MEEDKYRAIALLISNAYINGPGINPGAKVFLLELIKCIVEFKGVKVTVTFAHSRDHNMYFIKRFPVMYHMLCEYFVFRTHDGLPLIVKD